METKGAAGGDEPRLVTDEPRHAGMNDGIAGDDSTARGDKPWHAVGRTTARGDEPRQLGTLAGRDDPWQEQGRSTADRLLHGYGKTRGFWVTGSAGTGTVVYLAYPGQTAYPSRGMPGTYGYGTLIFPASQQKFYVEKSKKKSQILFVNRTALINCHTHK